MPYRTTHENSIKPHSRPLTWAEAVFQNLTTRLFSNDDATARQHGWQVTPTRHGLGRRYRDPRFDTIAACNGCSGTGADPGGAQCRNCSGGGRIVSKPSAPSSANAPSGRTA
jgi:DnaJ-class molecular chaperone